MKKRLQSIRHTFGMIKFSHSIFAIPFALVSLFEASGGWPGWRLFILIVVAMILARNTAMSFNRLVDAKIDSKNSRTATRHIPAGLVSRKFVFIFCIINALLFVGTSSLFNRLTLLLSPVALGIIYFYSFTKRFTSAAQVFLGLSLGIAPIASWIAVTGTLAPFPIVLGGAVLFWVAGFDMIYATQDYAHDKKEGLHSLIVKLGLARGLVVSRFFHFLTVILLGLLPLYGNLGSIYSVTVLVVAVLLVYEHTLVKAHDLSKVNAAFFTVNGFVGMIYLVGFLMDKIIG
ncbi:MAG TPA: 4-hydroxybenzoate octaprenyltransferase [Deltaproteobacteria bacterium]|nr:MAG: hypothetical protein A2048_08010 [Deltaproteobacteria bacterium GWA2_45_12]HBF13384.1 4-hydroxybenzoate octaprenyltransferase [Deltaproteobacteria bacterium]